MYADYIPAVWGLRFQVQVLTIPPDVLNYGGPFVFPDCRLEPVEAQVFEGTSFSHSPRLMTNILVQLKLHV